MNIDPSIALFSAAVGSFALGALAVRDGCRIMSAPFWLLGGTCVSVGIYLLT